MKRFITVPGTVLSVVLLAGSALAFIPPTAPSAAHDMEEAAAAIHSYLHDAGYSSSYGSHGLEEDSTTIHNDLHDWSNGNASESLIADDMDVLDATWKTFKQTIHQAQVLNAGDDELDELYEDTKDAYKELRFQLRKVEK